jgi:hypothetical protein
LSAWLHVCACVCLVCTWHVSPPSPLSSPWHAQLPQQSGTHTKSRHLRQ